MTLVLSVLGRESLWTVADRRLSSDGRPVKDDARKIMFLETNDGVAVLAYAGLGATARGTEPADWMSAVLRGRNWSLEQSLQALADALRREMPLHLARLATRGGPSHHVLVAAFVSEGPRMYTIDLALSPDRGQARFRHTRWVVSPDTPQARAPRLGVAGSGAAFLAGTANWQRPVLRLVRAHDRRVVSPHTVADAFAALNKRVSDADETVGPRCIVAWRNRKGGIHKGGGGHVCYTGVIRDKNTPSLPTIGSGMDVHALVQAMMPHMRRQLDSLRVGDAQTELDTKAINADLALLPDSPDEKLR